MVNPSRTFEYHPEAIREAHHAYHWYDRQSSEAADRFWHELRRARQLITESPASWTPYYFDTRVFPLRRFPYGLVYTTRDRVVYGLAVVHFKRRPGYWKDRLKE